MEEEESIQNEVNHLKKQGINKIIALGHSGIVVDERIGKTVEGIDVIVGGDEQFFFYTGNRPFQITNGKSSLSESETKTSFVCDQMYQIRKIVPLFWTLGPKQSSSLDR